MRLINCTRVQIGLLLVAGILHAQVPQPSVPRPAMNILVLEGEGAINNVRQRQGRDIVVQVRDGNRRPLPGAVVVFTLPNEGASATFVDGSRISTVVADNQGRAAVRAIKPNTVPGRIEILVNASLEGQTARATVTQFNMSVAQPKSNGKWIALGIIAGAAAAGGAVAITRRNQTSAAPPVPSTPISITAGTGTVGPPR